MTEYLQHGRVRLALHRLQSAPNPDACQPLLLLHGLGECASAHHPSSYAHWPGHVYALDFFLVHAILRGELQRGDLFAMVGSGAGLPGVVIAITCPQIQVSCVDTVGKKAAFIQQAAAALKLPNLRGIHARVESLKAEEGGGFDVVCSRAFASLVDFTTWSSSALKPGAVWMAMKGKHPADEIAALPASVSVFHVEQLVVPGLEAERCIVWLRPSSLA